MLLPGAGWEGCGGEWRCRKRQGDGICEPRVQAGAGAWRQLCRPGGTHKMRGKDAPAHGAADAGDEGGKEGDWLFLDQKGGQW